MNFFGLTVIAVAISVGCSQVFRPLDSSTYAIGKLTDCEKPEQPTSFPCNFPSDFTVPTLIANQISSTSDSIVGALAPFQGKNESAECINAIGQLMCDYLVQPKCLGNGQVQFREEYSVVSSSEANYILNTNLSPLIQIIELPSRAKSLQQLLSCCVRRVILHKFVS